MRSGTAQAATLAAIRRLGYIQIDTISVVARAHLHTLWNRNPRFRPAMLDRLVAERKVFEYWSHAAAYLPMEDYRFCLPRMHATRGSAGHWHQKNPQLMASVFKRIEEEGPLTVRDFEDTAPGRKAMWEWKPAKYALEQLFMEGRLMAVRRDGFNKVYDLTERVLPDEVDRRVPDEREFAEFLVRRYLGSHGIGRMTEFSHLRKGWGPGVLQAVDRMLEEGMVEEVELRGAKWLMAHDAATYLTKPLPRSRLRLLSPFDNLVIQRKRLQALFDFDYQIECYVPADKRRFGYFVLPILWQGRICARTDLKAHRDRGVLEIRSLVLEPYATRKRGFAEALVAELLRFANFNDCETVAIGVSVERSLARTLQNLLAAA